MPRTVQSHNGPTAAAEAARRALLESTRRRGAVQLAGADVLGLGAARRKAQSRRAEQERIRQERARERAVRTSLGSGTDLAVATYGEATLVEPPLNNVMAKSRAALTRRGPRPTDQGTVPTAMHRYLIDGRVFGGRRGKKRQPVTVLVDVSGSMTLSPSEVEALCEAAAGRARVVTYSGNAHTGSGEVRVVAKGMRRADGHHMIPPRFGWNVIDGPALEWLARQPGRLVWVSDGLVTDADGDTSRDLVRSAIQYVDSKGIVWVTDVDRALRLLDGTLSVEDRLVSRGRASRMTNELAAEMVRRPARW